MYWRFSWTTLISLTIFLSTFRFETLSFLSFSYRTWSVKMTWVLDHIKKSTFITPTFAKFLRTSFRSSTQFFKNLLPCRTTSRSYISHTQVISNASWHCSPFERSHRIWSQRYIFFLYSSWINHTIVFIANTNRNKKWQRRNVNALQYDRVCFLKSCVTNLSSDPIHQTGSVVIRLEQSTSWLDHVLPH